VAGIWPFVPDSSQLPVMGGSGQSGMILASWLGTGTVSPESGDGSRTSLDSSRNFQIPALAGFRPVPEFGLSDSSNGCQILAMVDCLSVKVDCII
jgi:hypothetical protein